MDPRDERIVGLGRAAKAKLQTGLKKELALARADLEQLVANCHDTFLNSASLSELADRRDAIARAALVVIKRERQLELFEKAFSQSS